MSKEVVGLFNKDQEKMIAQLIDKAIKFKNPLLEMADGFVFEQFVRLIDDLLFEKKIPENWQNPLEPILTAILDEDYELASDLIIVAMNNIVNIPWIEDDVEETIIDGLVKGIMALILKAINK